MFKSDLPVPDVLNFLDVFTGAVAVLVVLSFVLPRRWIKTIKRIAFPWMNRSRGE